MNSLIELDYSLLRSMFDGMSVAPRSLSADLLQIIALENAEPWRKKLCTLQWYLHYSCGKSIKEVLQTDLLGEAWTFENLGIPGSNDGNYQIMGSVPLKMTFSNTIFFLLPKCPTQNDSIVYFTIDALLKSKYPIRQLLSNSTSFRIIDVGISEAFDLDEPAALESNIRRNWIRMENAEIWFRNEKTTITNRIRAWHKANGLTLGYYLK